jgi:hypothetical protein
MATSTAPSTKKPVLAATLQDSRDVAEQRFREVMALLEAQSAPTRRHLHDEGRRLAQLLSERPPSLHFSLPAEVILPAISSAASNGHDGSNLAPVVRRNWATGGRLSHLSPGWQAGALSRRFDRLESSADAATAVAATLLRHATAQALVHDLLPSGRPVSYLPAEEGDLPSIPGNPPAASASLAEGRVNGHSDGELHVPYVPYARLFFLPQWVAFDGRDRLLVASVAQAQQALQAMRRFLAALDDAVCLAGTIVADPVYRQKRTGILGQLVNQGRAMARHLTLAAIATIRRRSAAGELNRGLRLALPYFDDQALELRKRNMIVIPAGRIVFLPGFVVRAARLEQAAVRADTRLSPTTRRHLLAELDTLEHAFASDGSRRADGR